MPPLPAARPAPPRAAPHLPLGAFLRVIPLLAPLLLGAPLPAAAAAPPADLGCATPRVIDALRGLGPAPHPGVFAAPPARPGPALPRPPDGKAVLGGAPDPAMSLQTDNFVLAWSDPTVPPATIEHAAAALERGWQAFIDEQGWPAPVSTDGHLLWVLLERELGGATGYTTEWFPGDGSFPEGVAIIYLDVDTHVDFGDAFFTSLAIHELMHAVQYGMREYAWETGGTEETWYWEASATHGSELGAPEVDGHQYTSAWFAEQPQLRFDSQEGFHQYGLFVLNAWLEHARGPGAMKAVWEAGADAPGAGWDGLLAGVAGGEPAAAWAEFGAAYGAGALPESGLYTPLAEAGALRDGAGGALPKLGLHAWRADAPGRWTAEGDAVVLAGPSGHGAEVDVLAGELLIVAAVGDDTRYTLVPAPDAPADSGGPSGGDGEDGSGGAGDAGGATPGGDGGGAKSGCAQAPGAGGGLGGGLAAALVALAARARRRSAPAEPPPGQGGRGVHR